MRRADRGPQRIQLGDERHEPLLQLTDRLELVLRVHHLLGQAIAGRLERVELGAPRELLRELLVDVGVQLGGAPYFFQLFDLMLPLILPPRMRAVGLCRQRKWHNCQNGQKANAEPNSAKLVDTLRHRTYRIVVRFYVLSQNKVA